MMGVREVKFPMEVNMILKGKVVEVRSADAPANIAKKRTVVIMFEDGQPLHSSVEIVNETLALDQKVVFANMPETLSCPSCGYPWDVVLSF